MAIGEFHVLPLVRQGQLAGCPGVIVLTCVLATQKVDTQFVVPMDIGSETTHRTVMSGQKPSVAQLMIKVKNL